VDMCISTVSELAGIRYGGLPQKVVEQFWPSGTKTDNTA